MLNKIIDVLKELNIKTYKISETTTESCELFFIKKALDMNRAKKVTHYSVTVYKDFLLEEEMMRGSSSVNIYSSMKEDEIKNTLKDAYYAASFVQNKFYPLTKGKHCSLICLPSKFSEHTLEENAKILADALFKYDNFEKGWVNSAEVFVYKSTSRIINSEGLDVSYEKYSSEVECVTQWIEQSDVELYNYFKFQDLEPETLSEKIKNAIEMTCCRDNAKVAPKTGKYKVILSHSNLKTIFSYYKDMSNTSYVYPKYSNFKIGDKICNNSLNITLKPRVPFDGEGVSLKETSLIEDGILKAYHGSSKFAYYLNVEPVGSIDGTKIACGETSFKDMKKGEYLHLVTFSDFQLDPLTGDFGGEIRLGFLSDGEKVTPVTGGSISGNIKDVQDNMILSKESQIDDWYDGPLAIQLSNVNISGI